MEAPSDPVLWVTLVVMLAGLAGSVLPGLPGVPLIFLSALVYAILTDFVATTYGARRFGASNWGTVGGAIGGIVGALVGALFLGIGALFGLILGTIAGVFLGEYIKRRQREAPGKPGLAQSERWDWRRASRAAGGVFVGYVVSAITQGFLGLLSVIVFVLALF